MKFIRVIFSIIVLLFIIVAFLLGGLYFFVDPNKLKPVLTQEVALRTGYQVTIDGKISWSFFPHLGIRMDKVAFAKPNQKVPFAELDDVRLTGQLGQFIHGLQQLDGDVSVSKLKLLGVHAENARLHAAWRQDTLSLTDIYADLYQGTLTGTASGKQFATMPTWNWGLQLSKVQLKPLLVDLVGANSQIKVGGLGNVNFIGQTSGLARDALLENLQGSGDFSLINGAVEGIDINYYIRLADAMINKRNVPESDHAGYTAFQSFTGQFTLKDGAFDSKNLKLTAPTFNASGAGAINLLNESLNYRLQVMPTIPNWPMPVPLLIDGRLASPNMHLDTLTLQSLITKEKLEQIGQKVQDEIKKLPAQADKFLQKLLGQ